MRRLLPLAKYLLQIVHCLIANDNMIAMPPFIGKRHPTIVFGGKYPWLKVLLSVPCIQKISDTTCEIKGICREIHLCTNDHYSPYYKPQMEMSMEWEVKGSSSVGVITYG